MKYKTLYPGIKVFCPVWGKGKIIEINTMRKDSYPIKVKFRKQVDSYTKKGQLIEGAKSTLQIIDSMYLPQKNFINTR